MSVHHSTLLRWTEQAEAEQICAIAMVEHEPQDVAACLVAPAAQPLPARPRQRLGWRRLGRLFGEGMQIIRDGGR
ncbi:MAG TPA: hypothetical protein VMF05_08995 [Stellaceae bacterium]|nr:hypothetical protein [Stellaceae bacterium]